MVWKGCPESLSRIWKGSISESFELPHTNRGGRDVREDPQAPDCPPSMTWREYAEQYTGMSIEEYASEFDLSTDSWDDEADSDLVRDDWIENAPRSETASGMVYFLPEDLDLGRTHISLDELQIEQILGYVEFIDGDSPGHDYLGVRVSSPIALSALQYRLDELGTGIKIDMG